MVESTEFGRWSEAGVPHRGWECSDVEILDAPEHICEMCDVALVRYVHVMRHADYPEALRVGCQCAAKMEEDYSAARAKAREQRAKSLHRRRSGWLTRRGWQRSQKGNSFINADGFNVTVYPYEGGWRGRVIHRASEYRRNAPTMPTKDAAKLAAFDLMVDLAKARPWSVAELWLDDACGPLHVEEWAMPPQRKRISD